jgi:transcriptional regulator with XRE-family HTH domain
VSEVSIVDINYSKIGTRIAARRRELGLTQETVTNITDISTNQLSNIENNHSVPTIETIMKLCEALKVTPDFFLLGIAKVTDTDSVKAISQKALLCTERQQKLVYEFISLLIKENY